MQKNNPLVQQSTDFAVAVLDLCKKMKYDPINNILINQICRSATSVSANIAEANVSYSKKDFKHKLSIALKEANETAHWLLLMCRSRFIKHEDYKQLDNQCQAIIKMLYCSIRTVTYSI